MFVYVWVQFSCFWLIAKQFHKIQSQHNIVHLLKHGRNSSPFCICICMDVCVCVTLNSHELFLILTFWFVFNFGSNNLNILCRIKRKSMRIPVDFFVWENIINDEFYKRKTHQRWLFYTIKSSMITFLYEKIINNDFSIRKDHQRWLLYSSLMTFNEEKFIAGNISIWKLVVDDLFEKSSLLVTYIW